MRKFFAVVKREYIQRVRTKFFVVATILGPVLMAGFTIVPAMMFSIKSGGPTRLAVVDQTGKMYERVAKEIKAGRKSRNDSETEDTQPPGSPKTSREQINQGGKLVEPAFTVEQAQLNNRPIDDVRRDLEARVQNRDLEGYVVLPPNLLTDGQPEFRARNSADLFTKGNVEDAINRAVRGQRLVENGISEKEVEKASERVSLRTIEAGGKESKGEASFFFVFGIGLLIYMSVLLYGQFVLGAVIEEKETRIAEILFSSMRSFPLMMGKLVGVSLVALTQLGIWAMAFLVFSLWAAGGSSITLPHIPPMLFVYFTVFFLMGYFIYSTVYAVVGSMVTTTQEGGQLALPVVLLLVAGFYLSFNIIRSPSSPLAFWASMFPFFAPITMLVRIVTETPPLWQILLSLGIGIATIVGLIWLASRIYRVGMLMYGKKATIPEVWRWVRQS
ncbi:MAG TPA: ABC transporter permease [Pyrinomonadaceae bacterium]|nr:ABC transporter permease [Pyrinomonadaceae bacterium]